MQAGYRKVTEDWGDGPLSTDSLGLKHGGPPYLDPNETSGEGTQQPIEASQPLVRPDTTLLCLAGAP